MFNFFFYPAPKVDLHGLGEIHVFFFIQLLNFILFLILSLWFGFIRNLILYFVLIILVHESFKIKYSLVDLKQLSVKWLKLKLKQIWELE